MPKFILTTLLAFILCSCATMNSQKSKGTDNWQQLVKIAEQKVEANNFDYIIDNLVSQSMKEAMTKKYGADKWRQQLINQKLKMISYYFGWMKTPKVTETATTISLIGEHGCYAIFEKTDGKILILDFGQEISSM